MHTISIPCCAPDIICIFSLFVYIELDFKYSTILTLSFSNPRPSSYSNKDESSLFKAIFIAFLKSCIGKISVEGFPLSKCIIPSFLILISSFLFLDDTNVPLPITLYIYPSFSKSSYAFTTVVLFTPINSDNFLIGCSFS